jgi:endonuclease YncB( thermonuclease family)
MPRVLRLGVGIGVLVLLSTLGPDAINGHRYPVNWAMTTENAPATGLLGAGPSILLGSPAWGAPAFIEATVTRVIDGMTLDAYVAGQRTAIRYLGAESLPSNQPCGTEALARNRQLAGTRVLLEEDSKYQFDGAGQQLYYAYTADGQSIDATLVREGLARAVRLDASHGAELAQLQAEAQAAGRGCLWSGSRTPTATPSPTRTTTPTPTSSSRRTMVTIVDNDPSSPEADTEQAFWGFGPHNILVTRGDTIVFVNPTTNKHQHTVTSLERVGGPFANRVNVGTLFDSSPQPQALVQPSQSFTLDTRPLAPGNYPYFCKLHPGMVAEITVTSRPPQ